MPRERDQILRDAARYFTRDGIRTVGLQDVADALRISRSTLYYHFTEKSDLIAEILTTTLTDFTAKVTEITAYPLSAGQRLTIIFRTVLRMQLDNPGVPLALVLRDGGASLKPDQRHAIITARDTYEDLFRQLVTTGITTGEFRPVHTKIAVIGLLSMLEEFDAWYDPAGTLTTDDIADIYADLFLTALANDRPPGPHAQIAGARPATDPAEAASGQTPARPATPIPPS